jgi:thiol-disulfide isomerase/thioredoxin
MRLILLLSALAMAGCDAPSGGAPDGGAAKQPAAPGVESAGRLDRSQAGSAAPDIAFEDPSGDPASLADFAGKPVLLNLWATWCAPCVAEMPTLDALAADRPGIRVIALSQDLEGRQKVDAFFERNKFASLEPYLDAELRLMGALKVQSLPTTILYDARGREVWRMTGAEDWKGPRAAALMAEATKN